MMDSYADGNPAKTLHATLERSMVEVLMRKYSEAESMLNQVDTASLTQAELAAYYKADLYLDGIKAVDEMIPAGDRKRIVERRHIKRLAYINNPEIEPFELIRRNGMQLYESGHAKEATVIDPRGELLNASNIQERLTMRNFMESLRSSGVETGGPATLSQADRQAFANQLDRLLAKR